MLHELLRIGLVLGLLLPLPAIADELADEAREAQDFGESLLDAAPDPAFEAGGERDQGAVQVGETRIDVNQLVPGGDRAEQERLQEFAGDLERLEAAGHARRVDQARDPSEAASVLRDVATLPKQSPQEFLAQDGGSLMAQSVQALTDPMSVAPEFPACTPTTTVTGGTTSYTTYRERTCEIVHRPTSCTRTMSLVDLSDAAFVAFDRQIVLERDEQFLVRLTEALPSGAVVLSADLEIEWQGQAGNVTWATPPAASNAWEGVLAIDHDPELCTRCDVSVRIVGPLRALEQQIASDPPGCLAESDGFCEARFTCHDDAPRVIGGLPLAGADAAGLQPLYPQSPQSNPPNALAPVCYVADADYTCRINTGEFCIDTPSGRTCTVNTDDSILADTCAPMVAADPTCSFQRSACTESGAGHGGWCYVESQVFRCADTVTGPSVSIHTQNHCAGQIRCAGDDCMDRRFDENGFSTVADGMAGMMVAQVYASDWKQPERTTNAVAEPKLFPGRPFECRKALGGAIDCCDQTETDAEQKWFEKYQRHTRRANATSSLSRYADEGEHGSWKTLADSNQWSSEQLSRPLTSGPETITAGNNADLDPDQGSVVGATTLLQPMNDEFIEESRYDNMGEVGWACSAQEFDLANQREIGNCLAIGSYCHASVLGACLDKRDVFCCFSSPASRLLRETIAGPNGVANGAFGTAREPRCDGILAEQARVQSLDVTDLKGRLAEAGIIPDADEVLARSSSDKLTGSNSNLADGARQDVQLRTSVRLGQINGAGVRDALHAEGAAAVPYLEVRDTPGHVSFTPAYLRANPGRPVMLAVQRQGTQGEASVRVRAAGIPGVAPVEQLVSWAAGEEGARTIRVDVPAQASGTVELRLSIVSGGIRLYPNDRAVIDVPGP